MKIGLSAVFLINSVCFSIHGYCQSETEDSISFQSALSNTIAVYKNQAADQSVLLNGNIYPEYVYPFRDASPFFMSEDFSSGSVVYDGMQFDSTALMYDDMRQFLITKNHVLRIQLVNERVSRFSIFGHNFIRLVADNSNKGLSKTGYYELLYTGYTPILKQTTKKLREVISSEDGVVRYIDQSDLFYVRIKNAYLEVRSYATLLDILDDHRKEIQRYTKKNKLNFHRNRESALVRIVSYYDQIAK
jgi:hypothetical protein